MFICIFILLRLLAFGRNIEWLDFLAIRWSFVLVWIKRNHLVQFNTDEILCTSFLSIQISKPNLIFDRLLNRFLCAKKSDAFVLFRLFSLSKNGFVDLVYLSFFFLSKASKMLKWHFTVEPQRQKWLYFVYGLRWSSTPLIAYTQHTRFIYNIVCIYAYVIRPHICV